jgi:hypothetical protein
MVMLAVLVAVVVCTAPDLQWLVEQEPLIKVMLAEIHLVSQVYLLAVVVEEQVAQEVLPLVILLEMAVME